VRLLATLGAPPPSAGKHSNTSQFYITFGPAPQCDQKHVVIGRVVEGLEVLKQIGGVQREGEGKQRRAAAVRYDGAPSSRPAAVLTAVRQMC
jgi:cyclophilin family peptidyl-prolyl cis-trans isomerase